MKHATLILLVCASFHSWAADPVTLQMIVQVQKLANASMCESYKGDTSALGKVMNQNCKNRQRAEFEALQDQKSLKDCMKPGNVIDEDVRKCMEGI
jgi:hypothetical protein